MVTTGAMTKRLDRLERRRLVSRRQSDVDGRGRVIALTPRGRELIDEAFTAHLANERRLLDEALSQTDAAAFEHVLTIWLAHYESSPDVPTRRGPDSSARPNSIGNHDRLPQ
jgi:DNA-binding MarR family transcriptional regulator